MTEPRSRFQRQTPAAPAVGEQQQAAVTRPAATPSSHSHTVSAADEAAVRQLQDRLQKTKERRLRREFERDQAQKEIEQCQAQARELGAETLEELEELVRKAEEADQKALEDFMAQLQAEEELLDKIDQQLRELDANK